MYIELPLYLDSKMRLFNCVFQEDMNLNEDKKAPLREKDLSIKKEMVMQYINTASKTVSKTVKWKNTAEACGGMKNNAFVCWSAYVGGRPESEGVRMYH